MTHDHSTNTGDDASPPASAPSGGPEPAMLGESIDSFLTRVATLAHGAIPGSDGAGLTVFDHRRADINAQSAEFVAHIDDVQYGMGEGPCIMAAAEGQTIRSGALGTEPRWPRFGPAAAALGVHSVLSLPLFSAGRVLGTINVYAHRPEAFSADAAESGERFAVSAAVAVLNARMMASAQRVASNLALALTNQVTIDQAVGVLIASEHLSPSRALARLRAAGGESGVSVAAVARQVINDKAPRAVQSGGAQ